MFEKAQYLDILLDEKAAAKVLGFSTRALQNWRFLGKGPKFIKFSRRGVRYRPSDLKNWIESHAVNSTSERV